MMLKEFDNKVLSIKNFLSLKEIDQIMSELKHKLSNKRNKYFKLSSRSRNIRFTKDRSLFDKDYYLAKEKKTWPKIYDSFQNLPSFNNILIPKIAKLSQKLILKKIRIITKGIRIMEKNDKRLYPLHQDYVGIDSNCFVVFWIALHDILKSEGGLLISKYMPNKKMPHVLNKMQYPILKNQKMWIKNCKEKNFKAGELLVLGRFVPHGTARKMQGTPRWSCIIRAGI